MSLSVWRTSSGIKRTGTSGYQALTDDSWFCYRFWLRRPCQMVVFLQAVNDSLDPKIYVDRGDGFDEGDATTLRHANACIYLITVSPPRRIRRIRIDPCGSPGEFRFWAKCTWSKAGLAKALDQAMALAQGRASTYDIVIDGSPAQGKRIKRPKRVADHFASVIRVAERTAPPVDASSVADAPFISFVVPLYNTSAKYLDDLLASFRRQPVGAAELILSDDGSTSLETQSWLSRQAGAVEVRVVQSKDNRGIAAATNLGIAAARGEWISFVDHDDALSPCAVPFIMQTAREHPDCKFIYTDEVVTDDKLRPVQYFFKPAYDEVLLSGVNYINHLSCYRRDRLLALGALREGFDGSQDYDLLLRYLRNLKPHEIKHLPYPAYQWRRSARAFSVQFQQGAVANARKAIAERYRLNGAQPAVEPAITKTLHRVRFEKFVTKWPRVSVVIPNRDSFALISRLLADLNGKTRYPDLEIIVTDNGTTDRRVLDLYQDAGQGSIPFKRDIEPAPFNFARQINRGIALATGELILLLNNDIEVIEPDWLTEMVSCFNYPATGIVGARLLYPSRRLQHVGVIVGLGGLAGHWFVGKQEGYPGPMARLHVRQSMTAVTGACMLISRSCWEKVGDFDAQNFAIAYNDIDFCLRAGEAGFRVVWTPFATLIHHESASRGSDETTANRARFEAEKANLRRRHATGTFVDQAFSPWYSLDASESTAELLDEIPKAR